MSKIEEITKGLTNENAAKVCETLGYLALVRIVRLAIITVLALTVAGLYGCPKYNVWQKSLAGQARLAEAEQSRKIAIEEAKALQESAKYKSEAEVIRAKGVSEANKIISEGLGGPEGYLRYLWIDSLQNAAGDVIYVPTEAGLPILEAGRRSK